MSYYNINTYELVEIVDEAIFEDTNILQLQTASAFNALTKSKIDEMLTLGAIDVNEKVFLYQLSDWMENNYIANPTDQQLNVILDSLYTETTGILNQNPGDVCLNIAGYLNDLSDSSHRTKQKNRIKKKKGDQMLGLFGALLGAVVGGIAAWFDADRKGKQGIDKVEHVIIGVLAGAAIGKWLPF
jgi:hypothetical protein